ncbi:uncharacterized protein LOC117182648 [Belonocnema kinseyi]|uniref:uncharacterized protein LOC117182648 n=1 Tax=Belonocnema kinseyi TaxID=2817044 RepID=UPI00143D2C23|nr:uncharacterized protein LOC117182648 [Belonocnema kinseyi]
MSRHHIRIKKKFYSKNSCPKNVFQKRTQKSRKTGRRVFVGGSTLIGNLIPSGIECIWLKDGIGSANQPRGQGRPQRAPSYEFLLDLRFAIKPPGESHREIACNHLSRLQTRLLLLQASVVIR